MSWMKSEPRQKTSSAAMQSARSRGTLRGHAAHPAPLPALRSRPGSGGSAAALELELQLLPRLFILSSHGSEHSASQPSAAPGRATAQHLHTSSCSRTTSRHSRALLSHFLSPVWSASFCLSLLFPFSSSLSVSIFLSCCWFLSLLYVCAWSGESVPSALSSGCRITELWNKSSGGGWRTGSARTGTQLRHPVDEDRNFSRKIGARKPLEWGFSFTRENLKRKQTPKNIKV